MKTKRILAMLMAMCMLAACSMVVSAEGETPVINYLSMDEEISGGLPSQEDYYEKCNGMTKVEESVTLPDGTTADYYFSLNTGKWGKSGSGIVQYQTNTKIPAQKYLLTGWYKTDTTFAHVQFDYPGGHTKVTITLPVTGAEWKQYFIIWDAAHATTSVTDPDTGDVTTYFNDASGNPTDSVFSGVYVNFLKPNTSKGQTSVYGDANYMYFCNAVLTPLTEDVAGTFETGIATPYESSSIYYCLKDDKVTPYQVTTKIKEGFDVNKMFNVLGAKVDSVAAGSEATFKFAPAALSVEAAKAQAGQIVLATYDETAGVKTLTGVEIVSSTPDIGGATCTIPAAFAGKTVKAYFWNSLGALTPIAAPATVTVPAA